MKQETFKKIVELAAGFEWYINRLEGVRVEFAESCFAYRSEIVRGNLLWKGTYYPLLLRRAVEGWNDIHAESSNYKNDINISPNVVLRYEKNVLEKVYRHAEYKKTEYLTPQEQAIEACLIELLEDK